MFDKEGDKADEGVEGVEALCAHQRGSVVLLAERPVAQVHAHLSRHPEKP